MKRFCPACGKESEWEVFMRPEIFDVRGENIPVEVEVLRCPECHEEFEDLKSKNDPYKSAYVIYRSRKGLLQPEALLSFRKKYNLTQKELGQVLGFGEVTLSRYENGALQDEAHDRLLREMMKPNNLLDFIQKNPGIIADKKQETLETQLLKEFTKALLPTCLQNQNPSILNGQRIFDFTKVVNMTKLLTHDHGVYKSKLLKLFYYADFLHYKTNKVSISGMKYAHATFGPVPDKHELILAILVEQDPSIEIQSTELGELYTSTTTFDASSLSIDEIASLTTVYKYFKEFNVKSIEEFSHFEPGWIKTPNGKIISYTYSSDLRI
jgi:putative zinc finger/helix-turn-helix YgiT family protein